MFKGNYQQIDSIYRFTIFNIFRGQGEGRIKEAFRKWFGNIGELRSLFPAATVLALSATCQHQPK